MEKGPQSSNKEGGDSKSLATPTATVSDYNAEEEMIHSLGGIAKEMYISYKKLLSKFKVC